MFSYKYKQWYSFSFFNGNPLLSTIHFTSDHVLKIIKNIDPNKLHSHDKISICMIKICDSSFCKPLELIFKSWLENRKFPTEWKRTNVVPTCKKGNKNKTWKIIVQYRCFLLLEKYLKEYCTIICMHTLQKIT